MCRSERIGTPILPAASPSDRRTCYLSCVSSFLDSRHRAERCPVSGYTGPRSRTGTSPERSSSWGAGETDMLMPTASSLSRWTRLVLDVSDETRVCQKKGWFDDEPRATPALPRGRADGGAGALRVSDASPCTLRTIAGKG